jgi:cobalt-zinc-cadmium efflux system outer membrane protein
MVALLGASPALAQGPGAGPRVGSRGDSAPLAPELRDASPGAAPTQYRSPQQTDGLFIEGSIALPLDAVVRHARDNAMKVRVARARLELGDAAVAGAKPLMIDNPQLYIGAGVRVTPQGRNFELQGTLQQPFEFGGERGLRIKAGKRYRDLLDRELMQVQWEAYAHVHFAFNMALLARARAKTAERTLAFSDRLLDVARRRARAGEISDLRVRVATGELAQARQAKLNADLEYRLACMHLSEMAGWPSGQIVTPAGDLIAPLRVRDGADVIAKLQAEHPALKARGAAVDLGEARVKSAQRDGLPEPWLGVYFGREQEPGINYPSYIALGMLTVPLPLWKRNQANRAQSRADLTVAEQELEALRYALEIGVRRAVDAVNTAAERVRTYASEVVPRFEENLALLERAFELGEVDILEVFVARENFLRIQNEALEAYRAYYEAVFTLESLLGSPLATLAGGPVANTSPNNTSPNNTPAGPAPAPAGR